MDTIDAVIFDPVGCLAEFAADEFNEIAALLNAGGDVGESGSSAYWGVVGLIQDADPSLLSAQRARIEELECRAVDRADTYEDVIPALTALQSMGISLLIASSLSETAIDRFLEKHSLRPYFRAVWTRDNAGGVGTAPLKKALENASLTPSRVMSLADTDEGLDAATEVGANSILMINDYEEGRRLAMRAPTGGIVSLHELPHAIRLVAENAKT
jgi:phosphoglycolate phosphatase-like HAD superfamily hydrolase